MREPKNYRDNLEQLNRMFPDKEILKVKERCKYLGVCYNTYKKKYPKHPKQMTKVSFAWEV